MLTSHTHTNKKCERAQRIEITTLKFIDMLARAALACVYTSGSMRTHHCLFIYVTKRNSFNIPTRDANRSPLCLGGTLQIRLFEVVQISWHKF